MTNLADLKARILANLEARAEYEAQAQEFELARELIAGERGWDLLPKEPNLLRRVRGLAQL